MAGWNCPLTRRRHSHLGFASLSSVWWQDADSLDVEHVLTDLFIWQIRARGRQAGKWERLQDSYQPTNTHCTPASPSPLATLTYTSHGILNEPCCHQYAGDELQVCILCSLNAQMHVTFSLRVFIDISAWKYGCKDVLRLYTTCLPQWRIHLFTQKHNSGCLIT